MSKAAQQTQQTDREQALLTAIRPFLRVRTRMPLRCVEALLLVATHPGRSVSELAKEAKLSVSTMSRNLRDIGESNRQGEPGFGWVQSTNSSSNFSALAYTLTPQGRALLNQVTTILEQAK